MLDKAGVKYFTADELFFRGASDQTLRLNTDPPKSLWKNMIPTAVVADEARARLGKPIRVLSGFRNAAYNRRVGGSRASQHMRFSAIDMGTDQPALLYKILLEMRRDGKFKGGLGLYRSFVHLDTRGVNANWAA